MKMGVIPNEYEMFKIMHNLTEDEIRRKEEEKKHVKILITQGDKSVYGEITGLMIKANKNTEKECIMFEIEGMVNQLTKR